MEKEITIIRRKTLLNNRRDWYIYLDDREYDVIHGGEVKKIYLDKNKHTISIRANDPNIGKVDRVLIPEGEGKYVFHISLSVTMIGNAFKNYIRIKQL